MISLSQTANELVSKMAEQDVYSILLSLMYDLRKVPEYTILSELCYLLDVESFMKFVKYFGGQTIKVPTKEEFSEVVQILLLYQYYEIEQRPWKDAVELAGFDSNHGKLAKNKLQKLKETLEKYNFGNRSY